MPVQLINNMRVVPLRLPPLPCKNITVSLKNIEQKIPNSLTLRKYSVHQLETSDDPDDAATCTGSSSNKIQIPINKNYTESCTSIRIREKSVPSRKIRKSTSIEQQTYSDLPPHVTARSWILYEMRGGRTLYGKRAKKQRQMASLTKIMNLITFLELLDKFSLNPKYLRVRATKISSSLEGTTANIKHLAEYNIDDLLYGMMLPSGNDAAFLVAEVGGYISQKKGESLGVDDMSDALERRQGCFVNAYLRQMNSLAQKIGMLKSNFANVHGLSNIQNVSCAQDLARLCAYAMRNKKFRRVVQTKKFQYSCFATISKSTQDHKVTTEPLGQKCIGVWENTNKMLGQGWSGIKTGITPNAGPCLAASLYKTFSGREYQFLVILLDSESMEVRWQEVEKLVNWAIITRQYL